MLLLLRLFPDAVSVRALEGAQLTCYHDFRKKSEMVLVKPGMDFFFIFVHIPFELI